MVGLKNKNDLIFFLERLKNWFLSNVKKSDVRLNRILNSFQETEEINEKYSKIFSLKDVKNYKFSSSLLKIDFLQEEINSIIPLPNVYRLIFVNGYFSQYLSDENIGLWKIKMQGDFSNLLLSNPIQPEFLHFLIDAFSKERIKIYLSPKSIEKKPLYILYINQGSKEKNILNIIQSCHEIYLTEQSEGSIIEHFIDLPSQGKKYLLGSKNVFYIKKESKLKYIQIFSQKEGYHIAYNDFHVEDDTNTNINIVTLNPKTVFNQINAKFNKKKSKFSIQGLSIVSKNSKHSIQNYIEHNAENCTSKQIHKIIALKGGVGIFDGLVKINQYAKKSYANVTSNNLILDKNSKIYAQPKLEIYINKVKCSHAITIGKIDDNQIFYFTSKGIKYQDARKIILFSFVFKIIESVHHIEVKNMIINNIKQTFDIEFV